MLHVVYLPSPELAKRKAPSAMQETALVRDVIHRVEDLAHGMIAEVGCSESVTFRRGKRDFQRRV